MIRERCQGGSEKLKKIFRRFPFSSAKVEALRKDGFIYRIFTSPVSALKHLL